MQVENRAFFHAPTIAERFWRRLGFRYHLGEEPEEADALQGWVRTDIRLHFDWGDRLRLLATGRLFIASTVYMDTPSPETCKSRVDWVVSMPRERDDAP